MSNTKMIQKLNEILSDCSAMELKLIFIFAEGYIRKRRNAAKAAQEVQR